MSVKEGLQVKVTDNIVSFGAGHALVQSLLTAAMGDQTPLSSIIEAVVTETVQARRLALPEEKRLFPRRNCEFPALVRTPQLPRIHTSTVLDVSLSGLKISIDEPTYTEMGHESGTSCLHVIFAIPSGRAAVRVTCTHQWTSAMGGNVDLGCSFSGCSLDDYAKLAGYLG